MASLDFAIDDLKDHVVSKMLNDAVNVNCIHQRDASSPAPARARRLSAGMRREGGGDDRGQVLETHAAFARSTFVAPADLVRWITEVIAEAAGRWMRARAPRPLAAQRARAAGRTRQSYFMRL
ncbi:hypothetical protein [Sinorhizobium meliloti]|uniref:hypothetical protein n=1 Tax=Rhizobium meliloti TaxID=382 RepID=UPI000FD824C6|nr:hypothetical protein [Sinorhizobium meliloti]RVG14967.1 hypothetical protein CN231_17770 [Sinorhizobium meliloti]